MQLALIDPLAEGVEEGSGDIFEELAGEVLDERVAVGGVRVDEGDQSTAASSFKRDRRLAVT